MTKNENHRSKLLKKNGSTLGLYMRSINQCSANQYSANQERQGTICKTERSREPKYMRDTHLKMKCIMASNDPVFEREKSPEKSLKIYTRNNWQKHTEYADKINKKYDSNKSRIIEKYDQWDVDKSQIIGDLKRNEKDIMANTQLMKRVFELKKSTDLEKKFPCLVSYKAPPKIAKISNFTKVTNAGYGGRNDWGTPFFS